MLKRILRVRGYTGLARYRASLAHNGDFIGWIPREVNSPYASGPSHGVLRDPKRGPVVIAETSHRCYDVYAVPEGTTIFATDDEATEAFMKEQR